MDALLNFIPFFRAARLFRPGGLLRVVAEHVALAAAWLAPGVQRCVPGVRPLALYVQQYVFCPR